MKTLKGSKAKKVNFVLKAPHASQVHLAGEFNDWNTMTHPMKKDKSGVWKISLNLLPGAYQYRFFADGGWQGDPESKECVPNPFGSHNCVRRVE
jgi:1,4-alpha-glucan branching enzyme